MDILGLAKWVVGNGFANWRQTAEADDPAEWDGAKTRTQSEIQFIRMVCAVGRKEPRQSLGRVGFRRMLYLWVQVPRANEK